LSRPFNALSNAPLQGVIVTRLFFFNTSFEVPYNVLSTRTLQCIIVAARPSTRRLRAHHRDVIAPFNASLSHALPPSLCASLQCIFARAIQLIVGAPFHVMSMHLSTASLWNRLIVACIHS
jgi:hypothetical protein